MTLMVDFKKMLSPEAKERIARHEKIVAEFRSMPLTDLVSDARHYLDNSQAPSYGDGRPMLKGTPVYDATMFYVIIPELLRRLEESSVASDEVTKLRAERDKYWHDLCDVVESLGKIAPEAAPYAAGWAKKVREERDLYFRGFELVRKALGLRHDDSPHVVAIAAELIGERDRLVVELNEERKRANFWAERWTRVREAWMAHCEEMPESARRAFADAVEGDFDFDDIISIARAMLNETTHGVPETLKPSLSEMISLLVNWVDVGSAPDKIDEWYPSTASRIRAFIAHEQNETGA